MTVALFILSLLQSLSPGGSIEGVVFKSGTVIQQALPNARLELTGGSGTPLVVRTDSGGRFVFSNLLPGRYRIAVTKDGFIRQEYQTRLILATGRRISDVVFRLEPAPTVAGWVQDEAGEPIADGIVQALRRSYDIRGNPTFTVIESGFKEYHRQYPIFWLDPGEYFFFVSSMPRSSDAQDASLLAQRTVPPTYFPGVADPMAAKSIRVEVGRETDGLDFRLRRTSITMVRGQLANSAGGRAVIGSVKLTPPLDVPSLSRYNVSSDNQGVFFILDPVSPGPYVAIARSASAERLIGFERIEIRALPLLPPPLPEYVIRFRMNAPMQLNGRFVVDSGSDIDVRRVKVQLAALQSGLPPIASLTQPDGRFSVTDLVPDNYLVSVAGLTGDAYMKAAVLGETDVLQAPLSLEKQSSAALPLQILLASDGGRMIVGVFDGDNRPLEAAQVVLVPDPARRQRPDQYRIAISAENGQVTIRGIPPGDYKLFAWEAIEPNAYLNKDYMRRYEDFGVPVRVAPSASIPLTAIRAIPPM